MEVLGHLVGSIVTGVVIEIIVYFICKWLDGRKG